MATVQLTDDGNLKIEVGEPDDITTQLGKNPSSFKPYTVKTRYSGVNVYYTYVIKNNYIPPSFKNTDEFVETLRMQAETNEFVQNYAELGAEYMSEYLKEIGLIDKNVYFVKVPTDINYLNNHYFEKFIGMSNNIIEDGITINTDIDTEKLSISDTAPKEAKEYFSGIFRQLNKVDAYYSFDELKIDPKNFIYLNGFIDINTQAFQKVPENAEIILVRDRIKNGHIIYDCIDQLSTRFNIIGVSTLFRQF